MSNIRVKTLYKDDKLLNDFLSLKDVELKRLHIRPSEYVVEYTKIKKRTPPKNIKKVSSSAQ